MKKLLLTSALVGVVSARGLPLGLLRSVRWLITALEGAKTAALNRCPGGRILSTGDTRGFYAVVGKRLA